MYSVFSTSISLSLCLCQSSCMQICMCMCIYTHMYMPDAHDITYVYMYIILHWPLYLKNHPKPWRWNVLFWPPCYLRKDSSSDERPPSDALSDKADWWIIQRTGPRSRFSWCAFVCLFQAKMKIEQQPRAPFEPWCFDQCCSFHSLLAQASCLHSERWRSLYISCFAFLPQFPHEAKVKEMRHRHPEIPRLLLKLRFECSNAFFESSQAFFEAPFEWCLEHERARSPSVS